MMSRNDDRFDAWLREVSARYNAPLEPSETPREEMWQRIVAARGSRRSARRYWQHPWTLAAAAVLFVAIGIGIGRLSESDSIDSGSSFAADTSVPLSYGVAATRHLASAEAFVTAVRMSSYAAADTGIQRWARDLLTDTRLLLDSPAGNDTRRRALLEDLELLLVQIMQLEDARTQDTNELLLDTTQQDQLLTRLRANVPAGPPARS